MGEPAVLDEEPANSLALNPGGRKRPEYVLWTDVGQIDFDRPPAMDPPLGVLKSAPVR